MKKTWAFFLGGVMLVGCSIFRTRVATPQFSPDTGIYTNTVTVTVSCSTKDAEIMMKRKVSFHSNTNLNLPAAVVTEDAWSVYSTPLTFRTNVLYVLVRVTLSAYAQKNGMDVSWTNSAVYELRK